MKWKNKGHEYDAIGAIFKESSSLYIYGDNYEGKNAYDLLRWLGCPVAMIRASSSLTDDVSYGGKKAVALLKNGDVSSIVRQVKRRLRGGGYWDIRKNDISYASEQTVKEDKDAIVLVSLHDDKRVGSVANELGKRLGIHVFALREFSKRLLGVYMLYKFDKVYFKSNDVIVTTRCTLNCEKCLNFNPYNRDRKDFDYDELKKSIDIFFDCVDVVAEFGVSGGEALMHKQISELLEYIGSNYGNRIYRLYSITNGTIIPDDNLIEIMEKYDISLKIDNYTEAVPNIEEKLNKLIKRLKTTSIKYELYKVENWFDLFPCAEDLSGLRDDEMIDRYDKCDNGFMELKDGKICTCNYVGFAATAGVVDREATDYFDLRNFDKTKKAELVEFRNGYSEKGYTEFCRTCNGFPTINKQKPIKSAIQVKGYLTYEGRQK